MDTDKNQAPPTTDASTSTSATPAAPNEVKIINDPAPMPEPVRRPPNKKWLIVSGIIVLLAATAGVTWFLTKGTDKKNSPAATTSETTPAAASDAATSTTAQTTLTLDTNKNYGDKYANGLLPVGDNKYVTNAAKKGYVYECAANFVPASQAGAQKRGPWFTNNNTQYDINKKSHIQGSVSWTPKMTNTVSGSTRTLATNDLPAHKTGVFPVGVNDPARAYDANPNSIKEQTLTYTLTASPSAGTAVCMGGEVGIMLTGIPLFTAFDTGGRDAGAWEVQDSCDGHPQDKGEYHYHTLSACITDQSVKTVIGFALDGFPITGPKVGEKNFLTTDDLDECHGITSAITLDGKTVTQYHYVMTQDFPYSVSCFRAKAANPPGQKEGAGGGVGAGMQPTPPAAGQAGQKPPVMPPPPKP